MATKINSYSKVLIRNTKEPDREAWLDLPFSEDEFNECLESIGVIVDDDECETDTYDLLMSGESITKFEVVGHSSDVLEDKHFADLDTANELVERLEDIDEYDNELLFALMADGDELDEAIDTVEDGAATFYSEMTLEDLAEQYVDEGVFSSEFLMKFIDFKALGEALADNGYTEVMWENTFDMPLNKFFSTKVYTCLRFDDSVGANNKGEGWGYFQFSELLSFGLSYTW